MKKQTAKTPTVAIARVLRGLGLVQGSDFRVVGARTATHAIVLSRKADKVIADNADHIEELVKLDGGWVFRVNIHSTPGGHLWTRVSNYGRRIHETHTWSEQGLVTESTTEQSVDDVTDTPATHDVAEGVTHPYDGKYQRQYGTLTWACETTDGVWFFQNAHNNPRYTLTAYNDGAKLNGWYLNGPGVDSHGVWMGFMFSAAAEEAESTIRAHLRRAGAVESAVCD